MYQPAVVTLDQRLKGDFILGERIVDSACIRRAVDWYGRAVLDAHSATDVQLQFGEKIVVTRALLDTGAAPNVMPEQLYKELNCAPLLEASPQLYSADKSAIRALSWTAPISLRFTSGEPMQVSFLVIPSKGRNHLLLGREFMLKYYLLVDLVRQEARIFQPGGDPSLTVALLDEESNEEPLPLPRVSPTVTPLSEGQMAYDIDMDEQEEFTCDSKQPSIPPAIDVYPNFEPYFPLPSDSGLWEANLDVHDLPNIDHLAEMLSPNDMDSLRRVLAGNVRAFARDKYERPGLLHTRPTQHRAH